MKSMRDLMDMVEAMSAQDAKQIFSDLGQPVDGLDAAGVKSAYRKLAPQVHPDKTGGNDADMKKLNAAYDAIKDQKAGRTTSSPETKPKARAKNFQDLYYVKEYFSEQCRGQSGVSYWTIWNFDIRFFRGCWTILGNESMLPEMARVMKIWDRFNGSTAVFAYTNKEPETLQLIQFGDKFYAGDGPRISFDSFNENPGNDNTMAERVREMLSQIYEDSRTPEEKAEAQRQREPRA